MEDRAKSYLEKAIVDAKMVVHGEVMTIKAGSAKDKLDAALRGLVESVYSKLNMVNHFVESDADILAILNGSADADFSLVGSGANNEDALNEISQWLELKSVGPPSLWGMYSGGTKPFPMAGTRSTSLPSLPVSLRSKNLHQVRRRGRRQG